MKINDLLPNSFKTSSCLGMIISFIGGWLLFIAVIAVIAFLIMLTWNNSIVYMFNAPEITYIPTVFFVLLFLIFKILFSIKIRFNNNKR